MPLSLRESVEYRPKPLELRFNPVETSERFYHFRLPVHVVEALSEGVQHGEQGGSTRGRSDARTTPCLRTKTAPASPAGVPLALPGSSGRVSFKLLFALAISLDVPGTGSKLSSVVPVEQAAHISRGNLFARGLAELLAHLRSRKDFPHWGALLQARKKRFFLLPGEKGPMASASPAPLQTLRTPTDCIAPPTATPPITNRPFSMHSSRSKGPLHCCPEGPSVAENCVNPKSVFCAEPWTSL